MTRVIFDLFSYAVGLIPLLGAALLVFVWLRTRRVNAAPADVVLPAADQWHAQVSSSTMFVRGGLGTISVASGHLAFQPDVPGEPAWSVPVPTLLAGKNSMLERQEVWVEAPGWGRLNITVSREHINQWMENDFKDLRERRYADQLLWMLGAAGATIVQGS